LLATAALIGPLSSTLASATTTYTAVDLYTLTAATGINDPGVANSIHPTDSAQNVGFGNTGGDNTEQGILWSSTGVATTLTPTNLSGFSMSVATSISGTQQVGYGGGTATGLTLANSFYHALLWTGSASSAVDLQPANLTSITSSEALGTDGTNQVGLGYTSEGGEHALLWSGSNSAVNLQPTQFSTYGASVAYGVSGSQQVGVAISQFDPNKPILWSGTAASPVDLTPPASVGSYDAGCVAYGIGGGQEVGYGGSFLSTIGNHALLWTGTAASAVDLNPAGSTDTVAYATNGTWQVGYIGITTNVNAPEPTPNAMVWSGTAASAVNLETFLPSNFGASTAYSVDSQGDIFGIAGDTSGNYDAVEWIPTSVPEPTSFALLFIPAIAVVRRPRR
jgi:hypothetical protein